MRHEFLLFLSIFTLSLSSFPSILADDTDYSCSASKPCSNGACCGASGYCGYGPTFCGTGCQSNCNAHAECGKYALNPGQTCPLNVCCSQFGFCGTTTEFCNASQGCQSNCGSPNAPSGSGNSATARVIGYYESWASGRSCDAWFPENLNPNAYTHINFAFASIDGASFSIVPAADSDTDLYSRTTALKQTNPDLKIFISVGGWAFNDPPTQNIFSNMASSSGNRQKFIRSLISFFQQYGFDGIDIDWEYPIAPERGGTTADKANYVSLLSDLRTAFDSTSAKYGLTITLPSSYWYLQNFDIVAMEKYLDWFNMMEYDLHGVWDGTDKYIGPVVGAHSNLTEIDVSLNLLWRNNIDPSKVVMGLGFYGRSFQLRNPSCTAPGCGFAGPANAGPCTNAPGTLSYSEIQNVISTTGVTPTWDKTAAVKYIVWNGDQWVSYDDADTFKQKIDYANQKSLGGLMIWSADQDDSTGTALSAIVGNSPQFNKGIKASSKAASDAFNTGQICTVSDCNTDGNCQPGYTALTVTKGKPTQPTYQCKKNQHREVCCPSSAVPQGCTWRGTAPFCNGVCHDGEITLTQDKSGDGHSCWTGTKVLCCPETTQQDILNQCQWHGTAPFCNGQCPTSGSGLTNQVTSGYGGGGNGALCLTGSKVLCCPDPSPYQGCSWRGTAPLCNGKCPDGKVMLYSDAGGDGLWCITGKKVYCCDPPSGTVNPAVVQFENDMKAFAANPSCDASQEPYDRRRSQKVSTRSIETHRKMHHLPASPPSSDNETTRDTTNISLIARASVTDPDTLSRLVDGFFPLLSAVYMNSGNPNLGSLNTDQLAISEAFAHTSLDTWGNVSLGAWSNRLHYTQQGNYASEGPPDPRADVLDMICEASDSKADTLGMLVLANSVCMSQKCGTTSSVCSTRSARRSLEGIEVLFDGDEGDDGNDDLLRRTFDQKSTGAGPGGNGEKPSLFTVINAIVDGRLPLLDFNYFNSGPPGSPDIQLEVVLDIRSFPDAAEYDTETQPDGWTVARDPDRVVVIHFHFAAPTCDVSTKGKRIQVKSINMWHGQHAGVHINTESVPDIEVGGKDKQKNKKKGQWGANLRFQVLNCPVSATWSVEDCSNPTAAQALDARGSPLNLKGDNKDRLSLVARLVQWLISQNILVWEDGLDVMWNGGNWWDDPSHRRGPHRGPDGGGGGAGALNRGPSALTSF